LYNIKQQIQRLQYSQVHGHQIFQVGLGSWVWTWRCEPRGYTWTALSTTTHTMDHGASCRRTCKYHTQCGCC